MSSSLHEAWARRGMVAHRISKATRDLAVSFCGKIDDEDLSDGSNHRRRLLLLEEADPALPQLPDEICLGFHGAYVSPVVPCVADPHAGSSTPTSSTGATSSVGGEASSMAAGPAVAGSVVAGPVTAGPVAATPVAALSRCCLGCHSCAPSAAAGASLHTVESPCATVVGEDDASTALEDMMAEVQRLEEQGRLVEASALMAQSFSDRVKDAPG